MKSDNYMRVRDSLILHENKYQVKEKSVLNWRLQNLFVRSIQGEEKRWFDLSWVVLRWDETPQDEIKLIFLTSTSLKVDDTPNGRLPRKDWFSPLCVMIYLIILLYVLNISVIQCVQFKK